MPENSMHLAPAQKIVKPALALRLSKIFFFNTIFQILKNT